MDRLVKNWFVSLFLGASLFGIVFTVALILAFKTEAHDVFHVAVCVVSLICLVNCLRYIIRYISRPTLHQINTRIDLSCGGLTFPEPTHPYELWIFCGVSFAQYHGEILVRANADDSGRIIKLPMRNALWHAVKTDLTPIIWRSGAPGLISSQCRLTFHLDPTFAGTLLDRRSDPCNSESITLVVKPK